MSSLNREDDRRLTNLSFGADRALGQLFKATKRTPLIQRQIEKIYNIFVSFIRRHEESYIKNISNIETKKEYYLELINTIEKFINEAKTDFPKYGITEEEKAMFETYVIAPLNQLFTFYSARRENLIPRAVATEIPRAVVEITPAETTTVPIVEPRFSANTNVPEGGFVSRLRTFMGRGFSNDNNNPLATAQSVIPTLEAAPPTEERLPTTFRRGNIPTRFQIGGGSAAGGSANP